MKKYLTLLAAALTLSLGAAHAADAPAAKTAQQNKMTVCNKEAAGKKGEERKAFMKDCLSAKPAVAASAPAAAAPASAASSTKKTAQQDKMKNCNKDAGDKKLKGEPRKAFMKDCLSK
jgi:hypothetical protein